MAERASPVHEETPLLPHSHDDETTRPVLHGRRFTVLLAFQVFLVGLGLAMVGLPTLRILEDIICRRRMLGVTDEIDEKLCKGMDDVQGELSFVIAMYSMFEVVPGASSPCALRWIDSDRYRAHPRIPVWTPCGQV